MNEALEALEELKRFYSKDFIYSVDGAQHISTPDKLFDIIKSALQDNRISSKYSKPFNVRVFRDNQLDIIRELDTIEEAEIFCKQWEKHYCLISKAINEKVPEHWKELEK